MMKVSECVGTFNYARAVDGKTYTNSIQLKNQNNSFLRHSARKRYIRRRNTQCLRKKNG